MYLHNISFNCYEFGEHILISITNFLLICKLLSTIQHTHSPLRKTIAFAIVEQTTPHPPSRTHQTCQLCIQSQGPPPNRFQLTVCYRARQTRVARAWPCIIDSIWLWFYFTLGNVISAESNSIWSANIDYHWNWTVAVFVFIYFCWNLNFVVDLSQHFSFRTKYT